ncbi:MAG: FG-GAP-like repeat-containing protein [Chloroherpetonaceae bacterium]
MLKIIYCYISVWLFIVSLGKSQVFSDATNEVRIHYPFSPFSAIDLFNSEVEDMVTSSPNNPFTGLTSQTRFYVNRYPPSFSNDIVGLDLSDTLIKVMHYTMPIIDLDNDGYKDLILGVNKNNGKLVIMWGDGNKFDMSQSALVGDSLLDRFGQNPFVSIADVNNDGYLDIICSSASDEYPTKLYYNSQGRTFIQGSMTSLFPTLSGYRIVWTRFIGDINGDSKPDFYVFARISNQGPFVGYIISQPFGYWDFGSFGSSDNLFIDFNSDGVLDRISFNLIQNNEFYEVNFFKGNGRMEFLPYDTMINSSIPLVFRSIVAYTSFQTDIFDLDNNGYADLFFSDYPIEEFPSLTEFDVKILLSKKAHSGKIFFKNIFPDSVLSNPLYFHLAKFSDYNGDGVVDILTNRQNPLIPAFNLAYQNFLPLGTGCHNFLKVKLEGVLSNREGICANVIVVNSDTTGGKWWRQLRVVNDGRMLHFGLGSTEVIDSLYVNWPSGRRDLLRNISANQTLTIREGSSPLSVVTSTPSPARSFQLAQNYPNPFNPTTTIRYELPVPSEVKLEVFDVLGRKVATLVNARMAAGQYDATLNASGLSSGVYFYRLEVRPSGSQVGTFVETKKMMLVK